MKKGQAVPVLALLRRDGVNALRAQLREQGRMPVDVMLDEMRFADQHGDDLIFDFVQQCKQMPVPDGEDPEEFRSAVQDYILQGFSVIRDVAIAKDRAVHIAALVAPYVHARLSAVAVAPMGGGDGTGPKKGLRVRFVEAAPDGSERELDMDLPFGVGAREAAE